MNWSVNFPIELLPLKINTLFRKEADFLYKDLSNNRCVVVLVPAQHQKYPGHMVRLAVAENPMWYRDLYSHYPNLKRQRSLRALDRIRNQNDQQVVEVPKSAVHTWWTYDALFREVIFDRLFYGYHENGYDLPPQKEARKFFRAEKKELSDYLD